MKQTINTFLNPIFTIAEQWFTISLSDFSNQLSEYLIDKSEKSNVTTIQSDCFTALHSINKSSNEAIDVFMASLAKNFQLIGSEHQASTLLSHQSRANQLNLIETKVLEENLSFDTAVGKITKDNREAFAHLEIRIFTMLENHGERISENPLSAENIISAFRDSMELFDFSPSLRVEVYHLFELYISEDISKLLEKLNNELISKGIMPKISTDYSIKKEKQDKQKVEPEIPEQAIQEEQNLRSYISTKKPNKPSMPQSGLNIPINRPDTFATQNSRMNPGHAAHNNFYSQNTEDQSARVQSPSGTSSRQSVSNLNNRYLDLAKQLSRGKNRQPERQNIPNQTSTPIPIKPEDELPQNETQGQNSFASNSQLNKLLGHSNSTSTNMAHRSEVNYFHTLKQIYADKHQEESNLTSTFTHEHETSTREIIEALFDVQYISSLRKNAHDDSMPSVHQQIKNNILASTDKSPESTQLKNNKLYLIDMIEDLFNHISDNKKLSSSARNLFQKLTIPLIHLTLVDETFIDNTTHVARLFLNDFADAAMGITDFERNLNNPIFLKLKKMTYQLAQKNKINGTVFSELHSDLKRFINHRKQFANTKSQSSRASATKKIDAIIRHCIDGKEIPKGITLILNKIWKNVLLNIYLDNTCDEEHRERSTAFINSLLFSIKPAQSSMERKRLESLIPIIDKELELGLARIKCPTDVNNKVTTYLEKLHHSALVNTFSQTPGNDDAIVYRNELFDDSGNTDYSSATVPLEDESISDDLILFDETINKKIVAKEVDSLEEAFVDEHAMSEPDTGVDSDLSVENKPQKDHPPERHSKTDYELIRLVGHSYKMKLINDNYTRIAKNIVEDAWLEFHFDTRFSRVKVTWIEDDHSQFNCLTQNNRVVEISLEALSDSFRQGICTVIQSSSIIDDAIKAVSDAASQ